jgi:hypothetical protein
MRRTTAPETATNKAVAGLIFVSILLSCALVLFTFFFYGLAQSLAFLPRSSWTDILILTALVLYLIGATDYPESVQRSALLRTMFTCWAVWFGALAILYSSASHFDPLTIMGYFIAGAVLLLLYCARVLYGWLRHH